MDQVEVVTYGEFADGSEDSVARGVIAAFPIERDDEGVAFGNDAVNDESLR